MKAQPNLLSAPGLPSYTRLVCKAQAHHLSPGAQELENSLARR